MSLVVLRPKWPAAFRRSIFGNKGRVSEVIVFDPQKPVELNDKQFAAIESDIGKALLLCDGEGQPDMRSTEEYVALKAATEAEAVKPKG